MSKVSGLKEASRASISCSSLFRPSSVLAFPAAESSVPADSVSTTVKSVSENGLNSLSSNMLIKFIDDYFVMEPEFKIWRKMGNCCMNFPLQPES